jgi:hypothetical protein
MATFTDRLLMILETQAKGLSSLAQTQSALGKTDQAATQTTKSTGKLAGAFDLVKSSGALAGVGIGTAATIAAKSLGAFTSLAKTAVDMSASLGITTDEASRWVAVADDYQISAEGMSKALLLVERDAAGAGDKIAAAGGSVKRLADGSVDVTGTMESVADGLNSIRDPAQRAAAGAALFGKKWSELAPLMATGGAAIDKAMRSVSAGQVITAKEAATAEEMRLAQDRLSDSLGDLERQLGGVLAKFAPLLDAVSAGVEGYGKLVDAVDGFENKLGPLGGALKSMTNPLGFLGDAVGFFTGKAHDAKKPVDALGDAMGDAADAATAMDDAYKAMTGALDQQSALLHAKDNFDELTDAQGKARDAAVRGSVDQIAAYRKVDEQTVATKQGVIRYAQALGNIPPAKVTEILALIDRGDYAAAKLAMDRLAADRTATVNIQLRGLQQLLNLGGLFNTSGFSVSTSGAPASSAPSSAPTVGLHAPAPVTRAAPAAAPVQIILNAAVLGNPAHISDAVVAGYRRATRVSGPRAIAVPEAP